MATVNKDFRVKYNVNLSNTADTASTASHYFVETGSDGVVRPKALSDVRTEIVTTASVNAAAATTVGTITSGTWNAGAVTSSGAISGTTGTFSSTISASGLAGSLLSATVGSALGTAAAGTSTIPARADHVHPTTGLMTNPLTTNGDTIYAVGTTPTRLAIGTAGQALVVNAGATAPAWTTLTLENLPGAFVKKSVRAATTANIATLAGGAPSTLDGVTLVANDRILVKDQSTAAQNGIYIVQTLGTGANGTWVRSADADAIAEIASAMVAVDEGTTNGGLTFDNDSKVTDTLGTTAIVWNRVVDVGYSVNIGTTAVPLNRASGTLTLAGLNLTSGSTTIGNTTLAQGGTVTITFPTLAGTLIGTGDSGTITTAMYANSSSTTTGVTYAKMQYVSAQYRLLGRITAAAGVVEELTPDNIVTVLGQATTRQGTGSVVLASSPTLTTPVIDTIAASAAGATPVLWSTVTTGSIGIGQGLTTGALNIATVGTGATPISIGHTNATLAVTTTGFNLTTAGQLTLGGALIAPAATTSIPSIRLPHGTAPSAPTNGDLWTTTAGLYVRINGTTVGPLGTGGGGAGTSVSDTAPGSPTSGQLWLDSTSMKTYIYYQDGTSNQWVQVGGGAIIATNLIGGNSTTLLGSIPYQSNTDTTTLLAPNTSATRAFLGMTGTGTNGAAPSWTSSTGTGNVVLAASPTLTGTVTVTGSVDASVSFLGQAADLVTTPSFTWTGDTTTGIYRPAASQVGVTIAGTQRGLFSATGLAVTGAISATTTITATSTISASGLAGSLLSATVGSTPAAAASAGTSTIPARADHVHPRELPSQTGNSGLFLTTNGTTPSWSAVIGSVYQATAPTATTGAIWTDSDDGVMRQYNGSAWVSPMNVEIFTPTFTTNNYTTILADQSRLLLCSNGATAGTVTISSGVAYIIGTQIQVVQTGTGQITLVGSGVTINGTPGLKLRTQYSAATLIKTAATTWLAVGDLAA